MKLINYYTHRYRQTAADLNAEQCEALLDGLALSDPHFQRRVLLEFAPLKTPQLLKLLEEGIEMELTGDVLPEYAEDEIERWAAALVRRAQQMAVKHSTGAFELIAGTIILVERYMPRVHDEGWTLQSTILDAFEKLNGLAAAYLPAQPAKQNKLVTLCRQAMTTNTDAFYEDEWQEIIDRITTAAQTA